MQYLKKRDDYIDIMKGSTMGLVVWAHIGLPGGNIIGYFHMPLFFLLSGLFFKPYTPKEFLKRKVRGLYVPFLAYEMTFLFLHNFFYGNGMYTTAEWSWMHPVTTLSYLLTEISHILLFDNVDEFLATLWFVTVLFLASVCWWWIHRWLKNTSAKLVVLVFLYSLSCVLKPLLVLNWPYNLHSIVSTTLMAIVFYGAGNLCGEYGIIGRVKAYCSNHSLPILELVLFGCLLLFRHMGLQADMRSSTYSIPLLFWVASIAGSLFWLMFIYRIYKYCQGHLLVLNTLMDHTGRWSFHFMALQFLAMKAFNYVYIKAYGIDWIHLGDFGVVSVAHIGGRCIAFLMTMAICYLAAKSIHLARSKAVKL